MNDLKEFLIPFAGLKLGKHQFDYQLDNAFFSHFDMMNLTMHQLK